MTFEQMRECQREDRVLIDLLATEIARLRERNDRLARELFAARLSVETTTRREQRFDAETFLQRIVERGAA